MKSIPQYERFVPELQLAALKRMYEEGSTTTKALNARFKDEFPDVPASSRTRWIRAFTAGVAHSNTPSWHKRTEQPRSIIPRRFSAIASGRFAEEREKWRKDGEIRYVNNGCWHEPLNDKGLKLLLFQVTHDFEPNVFPCFSDWLHCNRFSQHKPKPQTAVPEQPEDGVNRNKYRELEDLSRHCIEDVETVLPKGCTKLNLWGNHEQWTIRDLFAAALATNNHDLAEYFIEEYFQMLEDHDVLWMEMDERKFIPLTKDFYVTHGWMGTANEGASAKKYLDKFRGDVSIAAAHNHRQEKLWRTTPKERHFAALAGTLGPLRYSYTGQDFLGHNWGFQLITHPVDTWKLASVEDVEIFYIDGYYHARWRGKTYTEKAQFDYDELFDSIEIGA